MCAISILVASGSASADSPDTAIWEPPMITGIFRVVEGDDGEMRIEPMAPPETIIFND